MLTSTTQCFLIENNLGSGTNLELNMNNNNNTNNNDNYNKMSGSYQPPTQVTQRKSNNFLF